MAMVTDSEAVMTLPRPQELSGAEHAEIEARDTMPSQRRIPSNRPSFCCKLSVEPTSFQSLPSRQSKLNDWLRSTFQLICRCRMLSLATGLFSPKCMMHPLSNDLELSGCLRKRNHPLMTPRFPCCASPSTIETFLVLDPPPVFSSQGKGVIDIGLSCQTTTLLS